MAWYRKNPSLLVKEKEEIEKEYPTLVVHEQAAEYELSKEAKLSAKAIIVVGALPIFYNSEHLAAYNIRILIPSKYPDVRPKVFINDKSLYDYKPRIERHINDDFSACLCVSSDYKRFLGANYSIAKFIRKLVIPYFESQFYFDAHGKWPESGRAHGKDGIVEFIEEHTGVRSEEFTKLVLLLLSKKESIKTNNRCPCGSGKKSRNCHGPKLQKLQQMVAPQDANHDLQSMFG